MKNPETPTKKGLLVKTINATPPDDFPDVVIVMDKEIAKRHPEKGFYLRIKESSNGVKLVDLDGEITPVGARRKAQAMGHEPSQWMDSSDGILMRF